MSKKHYYTSQILEENFTNPESLLVNKIFDKNQDLLVGEQVENLKKTIEILDSMDALEYDINQLKKSIEQLKDLFLLVVVGEFNSGKSSFINAMLGEKLLKEGVTPTTSKINVLRYGNESVEKIEEKTAKIEQNYDEMYLPVPWLQQISIVDTPGLNAVITGHQELTENFVPNCDMVLFITSIDRPYSESERIFLQKIQQFSKKIIFIVSKIDNLDEQQDLASVVDFVETQLKTLFGFTPQVFPVSSKLALRSKLKLQNLQKDCKMSETEKLNFFKNDLDWNKSRFAHLESFLLSSLNSKERQILKLQNPIGLTEHFVKKYLQQAQIRSKIVKQDFVVLKKIEQDIADFRKECNEDYNYHESRIDSLLLALMQRGSLFFDENLVFTNAWELTKPESFRQKFRDTVIKNTSKEIETFILDMIDWLVGKQSKEWSRIVDYVKNYKMSNQNLNNQMDSISSEYPYERSEFIQKFVSSNDAFLKIYDKKQTEIISDIVQKTIFQTAAFELGVIGIVRFLISFFFFNFFRVLGSLLLY